MALGAGWLGTRALMLWLLLRDDAGWLGSGGVSREVHQLYFHWYGVLKQGGFPMADPLWQYPPGAGPVLLSPGLLPWLTYFQAFVTLTLLADAIVTVALARAGTRPGRTLAGALMWTGGLPLLLHVPLARYDVQVTAFAVLALLVTARSPRVGGVFAAFGAVIKVWPALTLLGTPRGRATRAAWTAAAVAVGASMTALAVTFRHPLEFLGEQGARGVQIESLGGTLLGVARRLGWPGEVRYRYGAMEFTGPYVDAVAGVSLVLTVAALGLLLMWRLRARHWNEATPFDAALTAVLLFTVTSRVISPQYMVWLIGLAAVCLTSRHTTQRPVALLLAAATATSTVVYPVLYSEVIASTWAGCLLMLLRNGLLTAATVLSFRRLWHSTRAGRPTAAEGSAQSVGSTQSVGSAQSIDSAEKADSGRNDIDSGQNTGSAQPAGPLGRPTKKA
ncbi:glycosyltransferase 87 family protein [Streptomyces sp. NPDC058001]|uniref:glycosyltransferase 87 family protein n=1 Tax=Streptomyces sp. NPDC058001 TaxID=3346300 RepID=UPI0036F0D87C